MDYGIKLSRPGFDVLTCTDQQLSFDSKFNYMKVFQSGQSNITVSSGSGFGTTTINHSVGFVPICLCYLRATAGSNPPKSYLLPCHLGDNGFGNAPLCYFGINSSQLKIYIAKDAGNTTTFLLRYYIFYNRIE